MVVADERVLVLSDRTAFDASDTDPADVIVVVDGGNEKLQIVVRVALGRGNVAEYRFEQRREIGALFKGGERRRAVTSRAEDHGAVKLLVGRVEIHEKLENFLLDLLNARVGLVYLVDNDNNGMVQLKRTLKHEARLGHGALCGIDQQQNSVDHLEHALDLTAEVCVTGGVNDIDLDVLVVDGCIFGKDRYSAFTLDVSRVHNAGAHFLIITKNTALLQHLIHERGLAMVNVGDNCDVSQIFSFYLHPNDSP